MVFAVVCCAIGIALALVSMEMAEYDIVTTCEDQGYFIQGDKVVYCQTDLLEAVINKKED